MRIEINIREYFLILVLRNFDFLFKIGYTIVEIFNNPKEFGVRFENKRINRSVYIYWDETDRFCFEIKRNRFRLLKERNINHFLDNKKVEKLFNISDLYIKINENNIGNITSHNADVLRNVLNELLSGKIWINEIQIKNNIKQ